MTDNEMLFLEYLVEETNGNIPEAAELTGISVKYGYALASKHKEEISLKVRDRLAIATIPASKKIIDSLEADHTSTKGELQLKAAESILDRSGVTKMQSMEVKVESDNGLFILPAKAPVVVDPEDSDES